MGHELVVQLAGLGCSVATCDINQQAMAETRRRALAAAPGGVQVTTHECDVADRESVERFRDEVTREHETDHINLLFNNAGMVGGDSFLAGDIEEWERVFRVCWEGVYNCSRAFLPLVVASETGYVVNTSSCAGFIGGGAYSVAKFAVRAFSEGLIGDLRRHAPHVKVAVVFPGAVGSGSFSRLASRADGNLEEVRARLLRIGLPLETASEPEVRQAAEIVSESWSELAPTTAAEAASIILDGVRAGRWRILIGDEAHRLDAAIRADPEGFYARDSPVGELGWAAFDLPVILLRALFDSDAAAGLTATYELRSRNECVTVRVEEGRLSIARVPCPTADAALVAEPATFRALFRGDETVEAALARGDLELSGDREAVAHLIAAVVPHANEEGGRNER